MRLAKGIVEFDNGVITIYPELGPLEDDSEKTEKSPDDLDQLLDFNFDDVPKFREELPPLVCMMRKSNHNKKRSMENLSSFYQDIGPSLSAGCSREAKSRYNTILANLLPRHIYSPCVVNWDVLNRMGCDGEIDDMLRIRLREDGSDEDIFTSVAWIRAFNINEPFYTELCHEFYSTYEFDEAAELDEEGFNIYFEGGLCSDKHFNAQDYWLSISREKNLSLSRSHASTIKYPVLWVIHKMITYGLCQKMTRKSRVLTDDMLRSLSDLVYYRDLDMTTFRELIDSESRLIPEDPQPGIPRVGIPRPPKAFMQDLYNRMGRIEIRQEAIERMEYRQSYH
uniref:Uncharacterized protein n=1 Tax=Tanacetum cinerariifolium TaxID=118510 RepID=A0A6L2KI96_TANCI|nr:hypothetical protein [Tanacetum cinerariifolium]